MDGLLRSVLELYHLAQETPVTEFPDLALAMLKSLVPFRSATWSEAELTPRVEILSVHLHNEPEEVRAKFSSLNSKHTRRVYMAARLAGRASFVNDTLAWFGGRDEAPMRAYVRKYDHHRNMLITDRHQWLSLYRPRDSDEYSESDRAIVSLLWSHLAEAMTINRALAVGNQIAGGPSRPAGVRALVDRKGVFLHCGMHFLDLLRLEWPDWSEPHIPLALLEELLSSADARVAKERVEIVAQTFGTAMLLTARAVPACERLSPRELAIAREFGDGKSYKTIARELQLSPATVRNVLQKTYRKLDIGNKAALVKLFERERRGALPQ